MSLLGSLTGLATAGLDMVVGGQLMKAKLEVDKQADPRAEYKFLDFQFNPEAITITRQQAQTSTPVMGSAIWRRRLRSMPRVSSRPPRVSVWSRCREAASWARWPGLA